MSIRHMRGTVTKIKMAETASVTVAVPKEHPLYHKRFTKHKTFSAHNPGNTYQVGDVVILEEHRPLSKTKHWIIKSRIGVTEKLPAYEIDKESAELSEQK